MARKTASTGQAGTQALAGAPTPSRQRGFAVTIKGFIPMGDGIDAQIATLQMIQELAGGDFAESVKHMVGVEVAHKQTSRVTEAAT